MEELEYYIIEKLLKEKTKAEEFVRHAIQNEHNPYAENGKERLKKATENAKRIQGDILDILYELT